MRRYSIKNGIADSLEEAMSKAMIFKSCYPNGEIEIVESKTEYGDWFTVTIWGVK